MNTNTALVGRVFCTLINSNIEPVGSFFFFFSTLYFNLKSKLQFWLENALRFGCL